MDEQQIRNLLVKVANDDTFRAQLKADPIATLAPLGIIVDPTNVPPTGVTLPPGSEIMQKLDELAGRLYLLNEGSWHFHLIWQPGYI